MNLLSFNFPYISLERVFFKSRSFNCAYLAKATGDAMFYANTPSFLSDTIEGIGRFVASTWKRVTFSLCWEFQPIRAENEVQRDLSKVIANHRILFIQNISYCRGHQVIKPTMKFLHALTMTSLALKTAVQAYGVAPKTRYVEIAVGNTIAKIPPSKARLARTGQKKIYDYTLYLNQLEGAADAIQQVQFFPDKIDDTYLPRSYTKQDGPPFKLDTTVGVCQLPC